MMEPDAALPEWARRAAEGDRAAAERLLRHLVPRVRNLVRYLVRGDDLVDDIAQSALLAVHRGLPSYRGDAPLERWADRVVARETFRHLKQARLREHRELGGDEVESMPAESMGHERFAARRQLVRLLDQIPEAQRVAVSLHHAAGLTVPEIAAMLDISSDTVKSRIRLGMGRLRILADAEDRGNA